MANIYARLGDADHAIPILKRLLQIPYGGAWLLTPATLRLDPIWDLIRNDPRFQELAPQKKKENERCRCQKNRLPCCRLKISAKTKKNAFFAGGRARRNPHESRQDCRPESNQPNER